MEKKAKVKEVLYYISLLDESVEVHASTKSRVRLTDRGVIFITKKEYDRLINGYSIFLYDYGLKCKIDKNEAFWMQDKPAYHTLKDFKKRRVVEWMTVDGLFKQSFVNSLNEAMELWKEAKRRGNNNVLINYV